MPDGSVVIASNGTLTLEQYDPLGAFMRAYGAAGRGPGEYQYLELVRTGSTASLVTFDAMAGRVITRDSVGRVTATAGMPPRLRPIFRYHDGSWLARIYGGLPSPTASGSTRTTARLLRLQLPTDTLATLGPFPAEDFVMRRGPNGPTGNEVPLGRRLLVAAMESTIVVAPTGEYEFRLVSPRGELQRIVRVDRERPLLSEAFRRAFRDSVLERFGRDDYGKREWTLLTDADVLPTQLSAFDGLVVGRDDHLWIRDAQVPPRRATVWHRFSRDGTPDSRLRYDGNADLLDATATHLLLLVRDELDREHVLLLRYRSAQGAA